jgi:hypothetical protein
MADYLVHFAQGMAFLWFLVSVAVPVTVYHDHGPYRSAALLLILVVLVVHVVLWRRRREFIKDWTSSRKP